MMTNFSPRRSILFLPIMLLLLLGLNGHSQQYVWPTEASELMTSSFCEFRPRHYHAAIDIKTWNQTGYKIFAVEDGYVYRIRVAATGYGKALYLKLKDGNYAIYGHLDGFSDELNAYTDSLRLAARNNVLDAFPDPARFPVKKGQHVGYTGDTGIGVPHLHFEMRDRYNRPINPLQFYKSRLADTIAPKGRFLAVIPQGATSLVNYEPDTLIVTLPQLAQVKTRPIYLSGRAYLALRAYDMANGATNQFDFYRAEMFINDSLVYQVQYDRFDYGETHLIEIDKNFSLWRKGYRYYHNFYRHPANSLPFYGKTAKGGGMLSGRSLKEGANTVRFKIYDYFDNLLEVEVPLIYHRLLSPRAENIRKSGARLTLDVKSPEPLRDFEVKRIVYNPLREFPVADYRAELRGDEVLSSYYYYHFDLPYTPGERGSAYRIGAKNEAGTRTLPLYIFPDSTERRLGSDGWHFRFSGASFGVTREGFPEVPTAALKPSVFFYQYRPDISFIAGSLERPEALITPFGPAHDERLRQRLARWEAVIPGKENTVYAPDRRLKLRFPSNAVYDTVYVEILQQANDYPLNPAYRYLADEYIARPFDQPMNNGAYLSITLPDSLARLPGIGAYYRKLNQAWRFLPTRIDDGGVTFTTRVTSLEKFTLIQDTIPPTITALNLSRFNKGRADALTFSLKDAMSGIYRETQIRVEVDGRWTLYEYDPEEKLLRVPRRHIPKGNHTVTITVSDNAGNEAVERVEVVN